MLLNQINQFYFLTKTGMWKILEVNKVIFQKKINKFHLEKIWRILLEKRLTQEERWKVAIEENLFNLISVHFSKALDI